MQQKAMQSNNNNILWYNNNSIDCRDQFHIDYSDHD